MAGTTKESPIRALTRSHDALRRHSNAIEGQIDELRQTIREEIGASEVDALDAIMFTIGDEDTKRSLAAYFQGDAHPILTMDKESVKALDMALAKQIVTQATVADDISVRINDQSKRVQQVNINSVQRGRTLR